MWDRLTRVTAAVLMAAALCGFLASPATADSAPASGRITPSSPRIGTGPVAPSGPGYWLLGNDGGIFTYGAANFYGSMGGQALFRPTVCMASMVNGRGYWLVGSDGGIFTYGAASFYGSTGGKALAKPVVGMASTPDGGGYWLVASDGGIFSFGDASFYGSTGGMALTKPVVGMTTTASGNGYWLAAQDGGVFTFGDATFEGSLAATPHNASVAGIAGIGRPGGCQGTVVPTDLPVPGAGGPLGEGQWTPAARFVGPTPAVYTTTLRPYPGGSPAGIAWTDMSRADLKLYAGPPSQPAGHFAASGQVAGSDRSRLLAAFNSGFQVTGSGGGFYSEGQMPVPLRTGAASLVIYNNGKAQIGMWGRDVGLSPDVASVRQNLNLLVDGGRPAADLSIPAWGAVIYGIASTWRSGIGTDRYGNLIYVGGPNLLPSDLAHLLLVAGAVEAMELDINPQWVTLSTYATAPGQANPAVVTGQNLIGGMYFGPDRFITSSERDFLATLAG